MRPAGGSGRLLRVGRKKDRSMAAFIRGVSLILTALCILTAVGGCVSTARLGQASGETRVTSSRIQTGLLFRSLATGDTMSKYAVYVPRDYDPAKPSPCILFLHGKGECGTDGQKQAVVGLGSAALLQHERWPFIVIFPQKPDEEKQWSEFEDLALSALSETRAEFAIDESRVYLSGLSQGGAGTWAIGARHPELFAALAPVCGYGDPVKVLGESSIKGLPIWAFHGEKDDVVKPELTRALVAAAEKAGAQVKATYFPEANHNSWDSAYRDTELPVWLLTNKREVK